MQALSSSAELKSPLAAALCTAMSGICSSSLSLQTAATLVAGVASPAASTIFLIRTMGGRFEMKAYRPFCFRHGDTTFKGEAPTHHRFHQ